jgi:hypothetical protein
MTAQQQADAALTTWQAIRSAYPDPAERIEILMADFFRAPVESALEYDATLNRVAEAMAAP